MKIPHVTELIRESGIGPSYDQVPKAFLDARAQFGTTVHALCSKAVKGDKVMLPDTEEGACAQEFVKWLWLTKAQVIRSEFKVNGDFMGFRYTGTADLVVIWNSKRYLLDIKTTSQLYSSYGVQLAAYEYAQENVYDAVRRGVLWIRPGTPARLVCEPPILRNSDLEMWKAIITTRAWIKGAKL